MLPIITQFVVSQKAYYAEIHSYPHFFLNLSKIYNDFALFLEKSSLFFDFNRI